MENQNKHVFFKALVLIVIVAAIGYFGYQRWHKGGEDTGYIPAQSRFLVLPDDSRSQLVNTVPTSIDSEEVQLNFTGSLNDSTAFYTDYFQEQGYTVTPQSTLNAGNILSLKKVGSFEGLLTVVEEAGGSRVIISLRQVD